MQSGSQTFFPAVFTRYPVYLDLRVSCNSVVGWGCLFKDIQSRNTYIYIYKYISNILKHNFQYFNEGDAPVRLSVLGLVVSSLETILHFHMITMSCSMAACTHTTHNTHRHACAHHRLMSLGGRRATRNMGNDGGVPMVPISDVCPDSWLSLLFESYVWSCMCPNRLNRQVKPNVWEHCQRGKQFALARGNVIKCN